MRGHPYMSYDSKFRKGQFSSKGLKSFPKFTSENLKNKSLEDRCLAGFISEIPGVTIFTGISIHGFTILLRSDFMSNFMG